MTYWIRWKSATCAAYDGPPVGPFTRHRDAVSRIEEDMNRFASELEHAAGKPGEWTWDTPRQVATLYRGDFLDETSIGSYLIEQVAPDSREK
jgi:hypothetical protein